MSSRGAFRHAIATGRTPSRQWRERQRRPVTWIAQRGPETEEEASIWEAVAQLGLPTYRDVGEYVAERMFRADYERYGGVVDLGLLRPLYRRHAYGTLERLDGSVIRIGGEAPWTF